MDIVASIFVGLAAALHVYIFLMESAWWTRPSVWKRFGLRSQEDANTTRPLAYNQGFYNLFLALGAFGGLALYWSDQTTAGCALVLFTMGCMLAASLVLLTSGKGYGRAAATQGTLPLIGLVLFWIACAS